MKTGFIYIWFDKLMKMFYLGCHWGSVNDRYVCSSTTMIKEYLRRPCDFIRRIIKGNIDDKKRMFLEEYRFLQMIRPNELGTRFYNLKRTLHGDTTPDGDRVRAGQLLQKKLKQIRGESIYVLTEKGLEGKRRGYKKMKTSGCLKGRKQTKEHIENNRKSQLARVRSFEVHPNVGRKDTDEMRLKKSKSMTLVWKRRRGELIV